MNELMQFLHMGGYAPYVWGAYGLALLTLALNLLPLLGAERRSLRKLARQLRRQTQTTEASA
jgi:heme exporter protein D